jgi:HK97 family phage major capsid protein
MRQERIHDLRRWISETRSEWAGEAFPAEVAAMQRVGVVEQERTAMATSPGAQGGFAIPYTLDPSILLSSTGALNPVRLLADVTQVSTHDWKGVSSDGVTAVYVAEGVEATDASPVLAQPAISTFQGRAFVPYSIELGQDYDTLTSELGKLIADARDVLDATMFLTGNPASNQPGGILNIGGTGGLTTTQRVQTATTATYVLADPWTFKAALPARWLNSVTFAANPATWDTTYRFVGGNSAEPLQMPTRDGPFMGRPKVEWSTMGTGTTTATKLIIGGDFSNYKIVDRIGMQVELIPHLFGATSRFPMGQRGLYAYWRTGAGVTVPNAFRYLEVK